MPSLTKPAPRRGEGCFFRDTVTADLGSELGRVQVIVSGCQRTKWNAGHQEKIRELLDSGATAEYAQRALQSWIDGGSPCDRTYAWDRDRMSADEAATEAAILANSGAGIPIIAFPSLRGSSLRASVLVIVDPGKHPNTQRGFRILAAIAQFARGVPNRFRNVWRV